MKIPSGCVAAFAILFAASLPQSVPIVDAAERDDTALRSLYDAHQWLELRRAVQKTADAPAFYRGAVGAAFNDASMAENYLGLVIASKTEQAYQAHALLTQMYMRASRYARALEEIEQALKYEPQNPGLRNAGALLRAFSQYPEQSVSVRRHSTVRYSMQGGNMFIPVGSEGKQGNYLVYTGANFSLISESEARLLGLTINESRGATIADSSGATVPFRIAVAHRLTVGNVQLRDVPFLVMRDDQQPFVELPAGKRAVLGLPVLLALQTVRWNRDGEFELGFAPGTRGNPNLYFDDQEAMFQGKLGERDLEVFLDTGATRTRLLPRFARDFSALLDEQGQKGSQRVTGVAGSVEVESVTLPEVRLQVHGRELISSPATVLLKDTLSDLRRCHVWIGMDLLSQAKSVTLDFRAMTIAVE